jgi:hypothetical protein
VAEPVPAKDLETIGKNSLEQVDAQLVAVQELNVQEKQVLRESVRPLPLRMIEEEVKIAAVDQQPVVEEPERVKNNNSWDGFEETPGNQNQPEEEKQDGAELMVV